MIVFETKGDLDLKAITTFGVSVKETDNPIGYFGTGLKYAIAVLLREGQEICIVRNGIEHQFRTFNAEFRGKEFDFVQMKGENGEWLELGFTTELGKNWKLWMAYRELWCNTKDEAGITSKQDKRKLTEGYTCIEVTGDKFEEVHDNRNDFILHTGPYQVGRLCEAHHGRGSCMFYKGIRVLDLEYRPTFLTYNLTGNYELTEDRTLKYQFYANRGIMSLVMESTDEDFIEAVLTAGDAFREYHMSWLDSGTDPGDTFMKVVGKLRAESRDTDRSLPPEAVELHRKLTQKDMLPTESITLNAVQQVQLERAQAFVRDILGADLDAYPLILCETLGPGHYGRAHGGKIYVALRAFEAGTKWVAAALYEEFIHLRERVDDNSHGQKMVYLEKILSLGEQIDGKPL